MGKMRRGNGAVIYVRVSTDEQSGPVNLLNQEKRCRDFCQQQGWPVVEVFTDPGESARTADRPEFQRMIRFCKAHRGEIGYVVVQDFSRFARNVQDQAETTANLQKIGILVRSAYETNIDESASGKLSATIVGGFNEYYSNSLSEKMRDRTRQSVTLGRFPWRAPIGYVNIGGKTGANIRPDPQRAPLIRLAFELMSTGGYKKTEALRRISEEGLRTTTGMTLSAQTLQAVLKNPIYAGWVTLPSDPDFAPVRGLHEPLVSQEVFDRVQSILSGRRPIVAPKRKFNPALPLKCLVRCEACGTPITGGFPKGRGKRYPRYWCRKAGCRAVKISKELLESEFLALLGRLRPEPKVLSEFPKIAARVWAEKQGDAEKQAKKLGERIDEQKRLKSELLRMRLRGEIPQTEFEQSNSEFGAEIAVLEQELQAINSSRATMDAFVRFAELQLMDIARAWQIADPEQRQRVQNLLFNDGLAFSSETGFLNRSKSSLYSVLEATATKNGLLASPTGFEPVLSP
jgi:site-specific DNA recombinase